MTHDDPINDPDLTERRHGMIIIAGRKLAAAGMVQFDEAKSTFTITDIGRIAAKYYIRHASIEVFQKEFRPKMTEADVLALLAMSTEVRERWLSVLHLTLPLVRANSSEGKRSRGTEGIGGRHAMSSQGTHHIIVLLSLT
jgi:hypothetical protein